MVERIGRYLDTTYEMLLLNDSGTAAMESAIVNLLAADKRVLAISTGAVGEDFCAM